MKKTLEPKGVIKGVINEHDEVKPNYIRKLFLDEEEQIAYLEKKKINVGYDNRLIKEELQERIKERCGNEVVKIKNIREIDLVFTKEGLPPDMFIPLKSCGIEIEKYVSCEYYFEGDE
jgi:hypothetical protein